MRRLRSFAVLGSVFLALSGSAAVSAQPWVTPCAGHLGESSSDALIQASENLSALYEQAARAKPFLDAGMTRIAAVAGSVYVPSGLKDRASVDAKIEGDYHGDPRRVLDFARGAFVADDLAQVYATLGAILSQSPGMGIRVLRFKDTFAEPKVTGYRDVKVNLEVDGHITEVQIHLRKLYLVKRERADAIYHEIRRIERTPYARDEVRLEALRQEHRQLYEEALADVP